MTSQPAWQTEELKDEWPDEGDEGSEPYTCSISLTIPVAPFSNPCSNPIHSGTGPNQDTDVSDVLGTFLIRQDTLPALPQRTPAQRKGLIKDFFSPIALERIFDPPSPAASVLPSPDPSVHNVTPHPLQPTSVPASSLTSLVSEEGSPNPPPTSTGSWRPDMSCHFTFSVPHVVPPADPPLRLFQFQYDTFTRDHLSAMVDSIAINSPSGSNTGNFVVNSSSPFGLPTVSEASAHSSSVGLRSAKRVKLSPAGDLDGLKNRTSCSVKRPLCRKVYAGESGFLMAQIKNAKDASTHSSPPITYLNSNDSPLLRDPKQGHTAPPSNIDSLGAGKDAVVAAPIGTSKKKDHSSLGYRQQAESLMAQLKQDMKGSKRIFSTDATDSSPSIDDAPRSIPPTDMPSSHLPFQNQRILSPTAQRGNPPRISLMDASRASSNKSRVSTHLTAPPILVAPPSSPPPHAPNPSLQPIVTTLELGAGTNDLPPAAARMTVTTTSSVLGRPSEDLNRFVSSSTASGTTLTAGSSGSFVKHPGPAQITRIGPDDVPALPERVGRMVFDKVMMRWIKAPMIELPRIRESGGGGSADIDAESEDPFRDIESLREDSLMGDGVGEQTPPSTDNSDEDDVGDEEMELTSFSFDGPSHGRMPAASVLGEDDTTDSDSDDKDVTDVSVLSASLSLVDPREVAFDPDSSDEEPHHEYALTVVKGTPARSREVSVPTPIRSVLKSAVASHAVSFVGPVISSQCTPTNQPGHRRSVSFSDGKREGPIRGLGRSTHPDSTDSETTNQVLVGDSPFEPSARSKRIGEMLDCLESVDDKSPSIPTSSARSPAGTLLPGTTKHSLGTDNKSDTGVPTSGIARRVPARPQHAISPNVELGVGAQLNATYLTEASFGVAHDKLVQVITDVQPFEPHWEELSSIDLANKNIESVARLKEFLPRLRTLSLNCNQLAWLSGVPGTVRSLSVSRNSLTRVTSFSHLLSLEHLDISFNNVESLSQLECLRHLRELRADGNRIKSLDGLQRMDCLVKLSLQRNRITEMDFTQRSWPRLEVLNASQNRIQRIAGLSLLPSLVILNLDNNSLDEFKSHGILPRLRILRLSANRLKCLDASHSPNLRMLYIDNNTLTELKKASTLNRLESLSLRNQGGNSLSLSIRDVRDVKRIYLSGNALPADFLSEPCYNLIYLEIAACRLSKLPANFSALVPNLRVLNLNYNFLDDVKPLEGLRRLNKLTIIGSRLKGTKGIIKVLRGCVDVEMVDFRMNPCTLGWYLPLLVKDAPGALQPSESRPRMDGGNGCQDASKPSDPDLGDRNEPGTTTRGGNRGSPRDGTSGVAPTLAWHELDAKFRRDLPDEAYIGRLTYRGLIMRACPRVRMLDGVVVSRKEREKAEKLLEGVAHTKG